MIQTVLVSIVAIGAIVAVGVGIFHFPLLQPLKGWRTVIANTGMAALAVFNHSLDQLAPYVDYLGNVQFQQVLDSNRAFWISLGISLANLYFRSQTTTKVGAEK